MPATLTDRLQGLTTSVAVKPACRAVALVNTTLSGEQTVNGVAVVTGDRVLLTAQTSSADNGIWVVDTGAWARAKDFDGARDVVQGTIVLVDAGGTESQAWRVSGPAGAIAVGTSLLTFARALFSDSASAAFSPSGTGAVSRTVQDKLREIEASVKDKGCVGDGTTNDYANFVLAAADYRRLKIPAGTYKLPFSATTGVTPVAGAVWEGEGRDQTILRFEPSSATYRTLINQASNGLTLRNMTISVVGISTQTLAMIVCGANGLTLENVKLDGGMTNVGAALSHTAHGISFPDTGTQTDVNLTQGSQITRCYNGFLKTNAATSTQRRISCIGVDFTGNFAEDAGFNSPGVGSVMDDISIVSCKFHDGAGSGASLSQLMLAFASCTNFRAANNSFSGVAAEAIHIEENCKGFAVTGNTVNVDGTGIALLDNNISGTSYMPTQGSVVGNIVRKAGTAKAANSRGIYLVNDASAEVPAKNIAITGNMVADFEDGIYSAATLDDSVTIANNGADNCTNGFRFTESSPLTRDNTSRGCTVGILGSIGSMVARHTFISCPTKVTAQNRPVVLMDPVVLTPEFSVAAGSTTVTALFPLQTNDRLYADATAMVFVDAATADVAIRTDSISWDGATFPAATNRLTYAPGAVSLSFTRASNALNSSFFSTNARSNVRLQVMLRGQMAVAP